MCFVELMNIAYFINDIHQIGGTEIATQRLAKSVAQHGHLVKIITPQAASQWKRRLFFTDYANNLKIIYLPIWQRSTHTFRYTLSAQALCAFPIFLHNIDILHVRGFTPEAILLARIAHIMGIKTLCVPMASGNYGDVARFPQGNVKKTINAFDQLSALTEPLRNELITFGFSPKSIAIIPNGVDIEMFCPNKSEAPGAGIIFVGQFRPEKRVDLLLNAFQIVQQKHPHTHFTLVGGGNNLSMYQQLASSLSIRVKFIPNTNPNEVINHLRSNTIFVQSGISEGMSNALLEAMSVGLAPIVSDTPSNRSVIKDSINGLCYSPTSAQELAHRIEILLENDLLRQKLATAARQTVETNFTLKTVTEQYLALYRQMLGENC